MEITIWDVIEIAIPILSLVAAWLAQRQRLPGNVRRWLSDIGDSNVEQLIVEANALRSMNTDERRRWVVGKLQDFVVSRFGVRLPTSIANLIVEYVYQQWKRRVSK